MYSCTLINTRFKNDCFNFDHQMSEIQLSHTFEMGKRNLGSPMCDVCGRTFTSKKNFISHLQATCHGKKSFNCDLCDKVFQFKKGMDEHKSTIHGDHLYKCEFCNQTFQKKSNLTRHTIKQHVTGPILLKTSTVIFRVKVY